MQTCPKCRNVNVIKLDDGLWCRNCNWVSTDIEPPRVAPKK